MKEKIPTLIAIIISSDQGDEEQHSKLLHICADTVKNKPLQKLDFLFLYGKILLKIFEKCISSSSCVTQ